MKKIKKILGILILTGFGIFLGSAIDNSSIEARTSCANLSCKWDYFGGFRCFSDGESGYNCDDSGYPECSETICTDPGTGG